MKIPDKEQIVPKIRNFETNSRHQADTLTLQGDDGYKYASNKVERCKTNETVKEALI